MRPARSGGHVVALILTCLGLLVGGRNAIAADAPLPADRKADFARDVGPILQANCHKCHGEARQKGDLRLDLREAALAGGISGKAIVPGDSVGSLLIQRITSEDDRMPPSPNDPLTAEQIALLRAWIDGGAAWPDDHAGDAVDPRTKHWAYQPPKRPEPPAVKHEAWARNPIDRFVLARLESEGLLPSPETDKATLIRRVTLDLTGLLPTVEEVDAFLADNSPDAYGQVVERLLASPHYGEQWGRHWLDAARYADTNGYEKDRPRDMWRYRDWVIDAFNADMPFDKFTVEQIAGDLLPDATVDQRVATGFHRNTMINEEGGIDTEEYRYRSIVDRVGTTGTVFMGMTLACAQCHNHKYDPISQREYYQFFALLNNADEPAIDVPTEPQQAAKRDAEARIAAVEATYEQVFPLPEEELTWTVLKPIEPKSAGGATFTALMDLSLLLSDTRPAEDTYTLTFKPDQPDIVAIRLEAMTDSSLPAAGPGRADNGNFVLTSISLAATPKDKPEETRAIALTNARADFSQAGYLVAHAIDADPGTGWGIGLDAKQPGSARQAVFELAEPLTLDGGVLRITLDQQHGGHHTLGRFRLLAGSLSAGRGAAAERLATMRRRHLRAEQAAWQASRETEVADWRVLRPTAFTSEKQATMRAQDDQSILVTGNRPTRDVYTVSYDTDVAGITGFRLEVMADPRLPNHGPGRGSATGDGNFMLNEMTVTAVPVNQPDAAPVELKLRDGSADFAGGFARRPSNAEHAIDGDIDTGWSVNGGEGQSHLAVFHVDDVPAFPGGTRLTFTLRQNFIDQHTLGRFRMSATTAGNDFRATGLPAEVEDVLALPDHWRNEQQRDDLRRAFLRTAPELDAEHQLVASIKSSIPKPTTALVMQERYDDPRETHIHLRGEFLDLGEKVAPGVPAVLPPLPAGDTPPRLALARWLVDERNPLTARVVMNRMWYHHFGRGIVETLEDFGLRSDPPSHPELLDWLATEFMRQGWSRKAMHRLIVTSATYRQSSRVSRDLLERDAYNVLLARGPRLRIEAESVRDIALQASGLLTDRIGGPSVYPPLPDGVMKLAYGGMSWPTSTGPDRYRRGIYTFWKRTVTHPGMTVFDAPSRETCVVRRVRSNTPMQALTLLNDAVFVEAAQGLARRMLDAAPDDPRAALIWAFRRCLSRPPEPAEADALLAMYEEQLAATETGGLDALKIAGLPAPPQPIAAASGSDAPISRPAVDDRTRRLAAWTVVSSVLLNLDETITRE